MNERMIQITQGDMEKLRRLIEARRNTRALDRDNLAMLAQELERAEIVPPANISVDAVTMHSRVLVRDLNSGIESCYTPVFPQDADIAQSKISILVPIATVLLGYRGGDEIEWPTPGGRRRLKIVKVLYQPEAAGDEPEHSVALYRQSRERDELTNLKSRLNEQEKVAYGRELPGEALISTTAEGEMK
jgi:regulator of nucleoside diphosphate kinase